MKDFNNYEKDLIKQHKNPKICIMSNGADWLYLNELINKFYANITIIGTDPKLIVELDKIKDYDIMIVDSSNSFSEVQYKDFLNVARSISIEYQKKISLIYGFNKDKRKVCIQNKADQEKIHDLGIVDDLYDIRDMIDTAYKFILPSKKRYEKKKKKSK